MNIFHRTVLDLTISNVARDGVGFGKNLFSDHRTIRLIKLMARNAVSCYKEAVQFSASFVMSLFASF